MFFFYTDFFFIDHFDCMIKMFCLKDQKKIPGSCLLLLLVAIVVVFFFDVVICVSSFFFS